MGTKGPRHPKALWEGHKVPPKNARFQDDPVQGKVASQRSCLINNEHHNSLVQEVPP